MVRMRNDAEGPVVRPEPEPFADGLFAPLRAPLHNGSTESVQAAASIMPVQGRMQRHILQLIAAHGPATCEEVEKLMDGKHQSVGPRLIELEARGFLSRPGDTAITSSGRKAKRWHITDRGREALGR